MGILDSKGFWAGGRRAYLRVLRDEEKETLLPLQQELQRVANLTTKRSLKCDIRSIKAEFRKRRKAAASSRFGTV
ncbi:MAG: hypothetical protein HN742_30600 [Lentisphaerae bacterium]|jgi:hypothetical protein|nr:hypothetical protein [Lentisphaerota bacterium]MBT4820959.1 hypothetical protein [Lentisphaerota bacterium]MBT5612081.1 hypothetical protein [Lentisphaerota bacterium]MBT7061876.1 hypothetical protein [Lentisphaerota bacterium]MBT7846261.1 hypothetical protein [Lentisphaerota bacterium]